MARESCNLNKDEAEILKPSSSSSSPPPPPSPPKSASSPPALFLKPPQDHHPIQRPENPDVTNSYTQKLEEQSQQQPQAEPGTGSVASTANPGISSCAQKRKDEDARQPPVRFTNRCSSCQRKVGLTGFRCRCGDLFCAQHRYSDTHDCLFDYKAAGREEIAKANPVIRAAKIIKI